MGIIKNVLLNMPNYHRITSIELHRKKQQIRIRTDVFNDHEAKGDPVMKQEHPINLKVLINNSAGEAERAVSAKEVKRVSDERIAELEKTLTSGKQLPKNKKDEIRQRVKFSLIARKKGDIGNNKLKMLFVDLNKKPVFQVAYGCLKMLDSFKGAVDK